MKIAAIFLVGACGHAVFNSSRFVVSLSALQLGGAPVTIGLLMALYGILPVFLGLPFGRLVDRIGVRRPMILCSLALLVGLLAPFVWLSFATLAVSALCIGFGFMGGLISANKAVAALSAPQERAGQLGWLSAATSLGGAIGPALTGFSIDHAGHRVTFALLALLPVLALAVLYTIGRQLPDERSGAAQRARGSARELWRDPRLRRVMWLSALVPVAMDTYFFFVPIIGAGLGWSASITGIVLGISVGAVVLARVFLPWAYRLMGPWTLVAVSYLLIALGYIVLPLVNLPGPMMGIAVLIGIGTGVAPPVLTSLLYAASPPGRQGEVIGLRAAMLAGLAGGAPLLAGAASSLLGIAPVLLALGAGLVWAARIAYRAS